jgi:hypothetical protein
MSSSGIATALEAGADSPKHMAEKATFQRAATRKGSLLVKAGLSRADAIIGQSVGRRHAAGASHPNPNRQRPFSI